VSDPIRFYFDFISPYAYVAWFSVQPLARAAGRELVPVPVLFAGLLRAHETKGPAEVPAKKVYVFKDAYRKAHKAGLGPLVPPPSHPFNPLVALRVAGLPMESDARFRLITALYRATWSGGGGVEGEARVAQIASAADFDGAELVRRAAEPEAKERLRLATDEAIALGVFGVPTAAVSGELFWGVDSLEHLADFVQGRDPLPADLTAAWTHLPATSTRRS
jgi:2-hydroxychromene-2-carboxylate isomerase